MPITGYFLVIPDWRPTLANELVGKHWAKAGRLKAADRELVAGYAVKQGIPKAAGRRRVDVMICGPFRGRMPDPDAPLKSLLDALVKAGLLVDDSAEWCELGVVSVDRAKRYETTVLLKEVGAKGGPESCSA